jgi:hypothetical protein
MVDTQASSASMTHTVVLQGNTCICSLDAVTFLQMMHHAPQGCNISEAAVPYHQAVHTDTVINTVIATKVNRGVRSKQAGSWA